MFNLLSFYRTYVLCSFSKMLVVEEDNGKCCCAKASLEWWNKRKSVGFRKIWSLMVYVFRATNLFRIYHCFYRQPYLPLFDKYFESFVSWRLESKSDDRLDLLDRASSLPLRPIYKWQKSMPSCKSRVRSTTETFLGFFKTESCLWWRLENTVVGPYRDPKKNHSHPAFNISMSREDDWLSMLQVNTHRCVASVLDDE